MKRRNVVAQSVLANLSVVTSMRRNDGGLSRLSGRTAFARSSRMPGNRGRGIVRAARGEDRAQRLESIRGGFPWGRLNGRERRGRFSLRPPKPKRMNADLTGSQRGRPLARMRRSAHQHTGIPPASSGSAPLRAESRLAARAGRRLWGEAFHAWLQGLRSNENNPICCKYR